MSAFLITQMFPGVVMAIPLCILLDKLLSTHSQAWCLFTPQPVPFSVWTKRLFRYPSSGPQAALLDGCSRWMIFRKIVLPLARPALAVVALFSFLTAWNEYILAATFMNDPHSYTLPIVLQSYVTDYGTEWGNFAAGSILVSMPVIVLFFALQHFSRPHGRRVKG